QLVIQVPCFVVQLLALADIAHERLDPRGAVRTGRICARRQLYPDRRAVCPAKTREIVADRSIARELPEQRRASLWIDEPIPIEGTYVRFGRLAGVAEHELQVRIRGESGRAVGTDGSDVNPFVYGFEQTRKSRAPEVHGRIIQTRIENCGSSQPGVGSRNPGFGSREAGVGSRNSGVGSREPGFGSRDSEVGIRRSGFGARTVAAEIARAIRDAHRKSQNAPDDYG